jgi:hypothetical protein
MQLQPAWTYLGSLIVGMLDHAKGVLVADVMTGDGLTVNANASNSTGVAVLKRSFNDESISAISVLGGVTTGDSPGAALSSFAVTINSMGKQDSHIKAEQR